jgi:type I restriction enzyme S subunit
MTELHTSESRPRWRPYPAYKDSGVPWLGKIPAHWEVKKLKFVSNLEMGQSPNSDDCNTDGEGTPFLQGNAEFGDKHPTPKIYCPTAKKYAKKDDFLLSVRAPVGALNIADQNYGIGRGLCAIKPNISILIHGYTYFLLDLIRVGLNAIATGSTYDAVSINQIGSLLCPIPCLDEQKNIKEFLNRETAKIDALVAKKERQIELLQEKRTALISRAVTRGLDPNVPLKDSGIDWIGQIPVHWQVLSFKRIGSLKGGSGFPNDEQGFLDEELPFYKVSDTNLMGNDIFMIFHNNSISRDTAIKLRAYIFPKNTIIFAKVGAALLLNKRRILIKESCIDNNMIGLIVKKCHLMWAYYLMCILDFARLANPGAVPSINEQQIGEMTIPIPPYNEQEKIAEFIDIEITKIDALITKIRGSIDKLKEYRTALISAAVTGKIDVRKEVSR